MGATPEQYKRWKAEANLGTLSLSRILEEMPDDQFFALGALSSWIFIGDKSMFDRDVDLLDEVYWKNMPCDDEHGDGHIMFLLQNVVDVHVRHWDGEPLLMLIKTDGREEGFVTFMRDYPTFRDLCKERLKAGQHLPRSITFGRNGEIVKREMIPSMRRQSKDVFHPKAVVVYDLQGNKVGRFNSIKAAAKFAGVPWYSLDKMVHHERKHPLYRFEFENIDEV